MSVLERLQSWYLERCNGDWEHQWGVEIHTIDNPGWRIEINLDFTPWADQEFSEIKREFSEDDWMQCWKEGAKFNGACSPSQLSAVLSHFLDFVGY